MVPLLDGVTIENVRRSSSGSELVNVTAIAVSSSVLSVCPSAVGGELDSESSIGPTVTVAVAATESTQPSLALKEKLSLPVNPGSGE